MASNQPKRPVRAKPAPAQGFAAMDNVAETLSEEAESTATVAPAIEPAAVEPESAWPVVAKSEPAAEPVTESAAVAEPITAPEPAEAPLAAKVDDVVAAVAISAAPVPLPMAAALGTETITEKVQTMYADMNDRAKSAMEKSSKMIEEMNEFTKGNVEALVESSKIAAKGFETMGQGAADYGRRSVESMTTAFKSFAAVKSPTELFKLQSDYMRQSFDSLVAESSKATEMAIKLAGEVAQPLSSRVAVAAEKAKLAA